MAGDHRCPVCQSTFTRPQHVARHMRSHTGDRPYKCQICGDQFARSDLLSRHVNKCHASDKASSGSGRRRGSSSQGAAAAARATVQAAVAAQEVQPVLSQCDQCKHAGLGCDLRSPCTTCHQRRISCTYPRLRAVTRKPGSDLGFSSATSSAIYPPPDLSVPSLLPSTGNLYSGSISDSASNYPSSFYIPSLPNGSDRRSSSLNLHSNTTGSLPGEHNLLNMFPQYASGANPTSGPQTQSSADHGIGMLPVPGSAPSTQTTFSNWNTAAGPGAGMTSDFASMGHNMNQPRPSSLVTDFMFDLPDSRPSTGTSLPSPRSLIDMSQPPIDIYGYRRSDQMSQSASESDFSSSSSPAVGRGSFSAGGNPLLGVNNDVYAQQVGVDGQLQRSDNSNPFAFDASQQPNGRNEVVSNFGMLSLEEAMRNNNAAGNAPFSFQPPQLPGQPQADMGAWSRPPSQAGRPGTGNSSSSAPAATGLDNNNQYAQMTDTGPGLPAISPSTEAREMREFWKNFMCDPYSTGDTPHSETPGAVRTPHGSRPAFMRGLSKSASLPPIRRQSFNTTNVGDRYAYDDSTPHASMAQQLGHAVNTAAPPKSLVNPADLRSYEEAIRARPPPVLKFDPRMGRTGAPHNSDLSGGEQGFAHSDSSRRGSLAGISDASPIPSIRRIAPAPGSAAATYSSSDENTSSRPSFKRLASQTLGPAYSKKAAHHRLGSDQADSPSASSASDAQADDDDSESSGDDGRGAPGAPRRHRGMRTGRRANAGVNNMLASGRMVIPVTGA